MRAGRWPAGRPAGLLTLFLDGWRRVVSAPGVLAVVWALNVAGLRGFYYLAHSYALGQLATGAEFIGIEDRRSRMVAGAGVGLVLLVWTFLWGGILDRYARPDEASARKFFAACWMYSGRMLRIGLIGGVAYTLAQYAQPALFNWIANVWPFNRQYTGWMEASSIWPPIYLSMLPGYAVFVLTDLTRVRLVVEDRRSVTFAVAAGWRLLASRPMAVLGIYLLMTLAFTALSGVWSLLPPIAGEGSASQVPVLLFWGGRVWAEMLIPATLVALYRAEMARGALAGQSEGAPALVPHMNTFMAKE